MDSVDTQRSRYTPVVFSGETGEYFRIWIVNMALTIVTLGIYSAWAKVRKLRYFYTHTSLADGNFDFHASAKAILFGRIIAVIGLTFYLFSGYLHPLAPVTTMLIVFALVPWLVVRSRIFRLRNSSYRGVRFNFKPNYKDAFKAYYLGALVLVFSFGLAGATAIFWRNKFAVGNSGFGRTSFEFGGQHSRFVSIYWKMIGLTVVMIFLYGILSAVVFSTFLNRPPPGEDSILADVVGFAITLPLIFGYLAVGVYFQTRVRNHLWNTTRVGDNQFLSTLSVTEMIGIYLTNTLAIIFSLGMLTPWAQIRLARYRATHTEVALAEDWESYIAADGSAGSALGDEIGDVFDVDIDLGF